MNTKQRQLLALAAELDITPNEFRELHEEGSRTFWCDSVSEDTLSHYDAESGERVYVWMKRSGQNHLVKLTAADAVRFGESLAAAGRKAR